MADRISARAAAHVRLLVSHGAPLSTVRDLLGHSSLATTSIYLHAAEQDRRRAIDLLGGAIPSDPDPAP